MRLSIIIPCYKVEKYIRRCLDSVLNINLPSADYEVICFDDCSPDNTPHILDEYANLYGNIRIVHSCANIGVGGGRNAASQIAKGQYLWFVDADDIVVPAFVPNLLRQAEEKRLDVLAFNHKDLDEDERPIRKMYDMKDTLVMRGVDIANVAFEGGLVNNMGFPWRFLLRHEFMKANNIVFPTGMMYGEDTAWMAKVVLLADRIQSSSMCAYIYWHHTTSICGQMNKYYPGRTIYERCIKTPESLFSLADELRKRDMRLMTKYAIELESFAVNHYLNFLPIMLGRTTRIERKCFYNNMQSNNHNNLLFDRADCLTRIMLKTYIGMVVAELFALTYKITHIKK